MRTHEETNSIPQHKVDGMVGPNDAVKTRKDMVEAVALHPNQEERSPWVAIGNEIEQFVAVRRFLIKIFNDRLARTLQVRIERVEITDDHMGYHSGTDQPICRTVGGNNLIGGVAPGDEGGHPDIGPGQYPQNPH